MRTKIVTYPLYVVLLHVLTWSIVLLFPFFAGSAGNQYKIGPLPGLYFTLSGVIHIILFYTNALFLYPRLLNRAYWLLYIVSIVLLILWSVWLKFRILAWWFPDVIEDAKSHVLFPSVLVFIVSLLYSITADKIRTEKLAQENEALRLGMELKFLRSQVSPHFLFNVLTNFVLLARKKPDRLEASLLMLSGLMRYMLYDTGKKISLEQEVAYLESYIALQTLRFGCDVKIASRMELPEVAKGWAIEPMLLIPFVENAFKHGTGVEDEPFIDIVFSIRDGVLVFEVENSFDPAHDERKDETPGIGLENVRSRLMLLYPGRHELVITEGNCLFEVHLTLNLLS